MEWVIDNRGARERRSHLRTLAVFAHTLSCSGRVLGRAAVDRASPDRVDRIVDRWVAHTFRISRSSLRREGHEGLGAPCVLLSNHRSLLDIPAICGTWPGRVRFVAKAELRRVPGFGAAMDQAGIVFVERGDRASAIAALDGAMSRIGPQSSLWIAAEGRRTDDDALGTLKKGPFHVARAAGLPIVPVWIRGTHDVLPARSLRCRTGQVVTVRYGRPLPTDRDDIPTLMDYAGAALRELASR